jgi:hypothetical protein
MSAVCTQTTQMDVSGMRMPSPVKPGQPGQGEQPYVHSPVAAHEPPPVRNMSMSTASTSGSVELPQLRSHEPDASQSVGTFMSGQVRHRSFVGHPFAELNVFYVPIVLVVYAHALRQTVHLRPGAVYPFPFMNASLHVRAPRCVTLLASC